MHPSSHNQDLMLITRRLAQKDKMERMLDLDAQNGMNAGFRCKFLLFKVREVIARNSLFWIATQDYWSHS